MKSNLILYKRLIEAFLNAGYKSIPFVESPPEKEGLLLRHDVDFDVQLANDLGTLENAIGVKSTFFFMLSSASYNLAEPNNVKAVMALKDAGHHISLHFDPTPYSDFKTGLSEELEIFDRLFGVTPECISIHRPNEYFLRYDSPINNIRHTYQSIYRTTIKYFSDSQGSFNYGHPLESVEFANKRSIQLLIHPIWWVTDKTEPVGILNDFLDMRIDRFKRHMAANCKPYRNDGKKND